MSKDIKDYLFLYLGCEVHMEGEHTYNYTLLGEHLDIFNPEKEKLILRPLGDMSEEEKVLLEFYDCNASIPDMSFNPKAFLFLLSKHFDLFNLIPEGLAIDATTLNQQ